MYRLHLTQNLVHHTAKMWGVTQMGLTFQRTKTQGDTRMGLRPQGDLQPGSSRDTPSAGTTSFSGRVLAGLIWVQASTRRAETQQPHRLLMSSSQDSGWDCGKRWGDPNRTQARGQAWRSSDVLCDGTKMAKNPKVDQPDAESGHVRLRKGHEGKRLSRLYRQYPQVSAGADSMVRKPRHTTC